MKQYNIVVFLAFFTYLGTGCSKTEKQQSPIIQMQLSMDTNFIKIVNLEQELNSFIMQLAENKGLTLPAFQKKIQALNDKDLNSTRDRKLLNEYIGAANVIYLTDYTKSYNTTWTKLKSRYNYISMQNIDEACKQLYARHYNNIDGISSLSGPIATNSLISINKVNDCGWRFSLCMGAATAGAILCHVSCIGATAGLGTPACVVLCATLEAAAGVACIDNYCPIP